MFFLLLLAEMIVGITRSCVFYFFISLFSFSLFLFEFIHKGNSNNINKTLILSKDEKFACYICFFFFALYTYNIFSFVYFLLLCWMFLLFLLVQLRHTIDLSLLICLYRLLLCFTMSKTRNTTNYADSKKQII